MGKDSINHSCHGHQLVKEWKWANLYEGECWFGHHGHHLYDGGGGEGLGDGGGGIGLGLEMMKQVIGIIGFFYWNENLNITL